jgi:hypothetical protein
MRYRKKPVIIEAWPTRDIINAAANNWSGLPKAIVDAYERGDVIFLPDAVVINTLEGKHRADLADFIICGVAGELYPCKPDIFAATYEEVI